MAEQSLSTVPSGGKPACLESFRLSLARIELEATQKTFTILAEAMAYAVNIVDTDRAAALAVVDFATCDTIPIPNRLDNVQTLLDVEAQA